MDYVDEQYTAGGVITLDQTSLVVKHIDTIRVPYGAEGSRQVSEWASNGAFVAVLAIEGSNSSYQPVVTYSGTTLSWATGVAPLLGSAAVDIVYGYY